MAKEIFARIIKTGKRVEVYKSKVNGNWIEFPNCITEHKPNEVIIER